MSRETFNGQDCDLDRRVKKAYESMDAPKDLWCRIRTTFEQQQRAPTAVPRRRNYWILPAYAATLCAVLVWVVWLQIRPEMLLAETSFPAELANEFDTFLVSERDFDITSSDARILTEWFSSRLDQPLPPGPPVDASLPLAGARLCQIRRSRVVSYVYMVNDTMVSLYITRIGKTKTGAWPDVRHLTVSPQREFAYATWQRDDWEYFLIAALPDPQVAEIAARLVRQ